MSDLTWPPIDSHTPLAFYNNWRIDELNSRISSRIYPDLVIPQSISPRAIETRQTVLGKSTDPRNLDEVVAIGGYSVQASSIKDNFICGDSGEPQWFLANIDTETILRNQTFALQKDCPQSTYMPSRDSELYRPTMPTNSTPVAQPFPLLFGRMRFSQNARVGTGRRESLVTDKRNDFIQLTESENLYRNQASTISHHQRHRNFYGIDRASLSQPFSR
jgi:hypothetical protein